MYYVLSSLWVRIIYVSMGRYYYLPSDFLPHHPIFLAFRLLLEVQNHGICCHRPSVLHIRSTVRRKEAELGKDVVHIALGTTAPRRHGEKK